MTETDDAIAARIRAVRPEPDSRVVPLETLIADLIVDRIAIDDRLDDVWHLIGQGTASARAFEALRSALAADVDTRFTPVLHGLPAAQRRDVIRAIDATVSLAAVHCLRREWHESAEDAARILSDRLRGVLPVGHRPDGRRMLETSS